METKARASILLLFAMSVTVCVCRGQRYDEAETFLGDLQLELALSVKTMDKIARIETLAQFYHLESACPLWKSVTTVLDHTNVTHTEEEFISVRLATCEKISQTSDLEIVTMAGVCSGSALDYLCNRLDLGESYFLVGDVNATSSVTEELEWVSRNFNTTLANQIFQHY